MISFIDNVRKFLWNSAQELSTTTCNEEVIYLQRLSWPLKSLYVGVSFIHTELTSLDVCVSLIYTERSFYISSKFQMNFTIILILDFHKHSHEISYVMI